MVGTTEAWKEMGLKVRLLQLQVWETEEWSRLTAFREEIRRSEPLPRSVSY
jgi:hypothetical protein